tara:strand:+ start:202 stop:453 length:252 start_codon:yes stop_codon:yes gene_type:complete
VKITKRQLRRIIKEEKARLREGRMAELEMQLVDEIVDLLIERGAINDGDKLNDDLYQDALDYVRKAIVPALSSLASRGAYDRK